MSKSLTLPFDFVAYIFLGMSQLFFMQDVSKPLSTNDWEGSCLVALKIIAWVGLHKGNCQSVIIDLF